MCVSYPQVTYYPLKAITEFHKDSQSPNRTYNTMCNKMYENMNKKLVNSMMQVIKELHLISRITNDEKLIGTLKRILNFSDHLQQNKTIEKIWNNYIREIYRIGFLNE